MNCAVTVNVVTSCMSFFFGWREGMRDLPFIASIFIYACANQFTCLRTLKLRDNGNPPSLSRMKQQVYTHIPLSHNAPHPAKRCQSHLSSYWIIDVPVFSLKWSLTISESSHLILPFSQDTNYRAIDNQPFA